MEVDDFSSSIDSLNSLVEEYKGLERQMNNPTHRSLVWKSLNDAERVCGPVYDPFYPEIIVWKRIKSGLFIEDERRRRLSETSTRGNLWSWYNAWPVSMAHNTRWRNSREKTIRSRDDRTSEVLFVEETYSSILNRVFILNLIGYWLIYVLTLYYDMQVQCT